MLSILLFKYCCDFNAGYLKWGFIMIYYDSYCVRYPFHQGVLSKHTFWISSELLHQYFAFKWDVSDLSHRSYCKSAICLCLVLEIPLHDVAKPSGTFWKNRVIVVCACPWYFIIPWFSKLGPGTPWDSWCIGSGSLVWTKHHWNMKPLKHVHGLFFR